jgi:hypothetical protein
MEKMKRWNLLGLLIVVALLGAGCGKPPEAQFEQATAALKAAEAAGAPEYAPDAWGRAKQAVERVRTELDSQGRRFTLFRNYGKVRTLAAEAVRLAEQALTDANAKKTQLRGEVTAMIAEIDASLQAARSQLSRFSRTRGLDAASLRTTLNDAGRQLDRARADLAAGAFDRAMQVAAQARDGITRVFKAIEKATGVPASRKR